MMIWLVVPRCTISLMVPLVVVAISYQRIPGNVRMLSFPEWVGITDLTVGKPVK